MAAKYYKTKDGLFIKTTGVKIISCSDTGCNFQKNRFNIDYFVGDKDYEVATESEFENVYRKIHQEQVEFMSMAKDITEN